MRSTLAALACAVLMVPAALADTTVDTAAPPAPPSLAAALRLNQPGPEQRALSRDAGTWDVISTITPGPGAQPVVTRNLLAERRMVGPMLQETMKPAPGAGGPDFRRIDYLSFDRVEGRWKYVSMDTRFPVSIMPASGFVAAADGSIALTFAPQGFVGFGDQVEGRFMISDMTIRHRDPDHMVKQQRVLIAGDPPRTWILARYDYSRRK